VMQNAAERIRSFLLTGPRGGERVQAAEAGD
jgi:hypothetical protein